MSSISAWTIRNPVPTIVLFIILTLSGAVAFTELRINDMPDMDVLAVNVTVVRPGSAPSELETQVARVIEDSVSGLGNVQHIRSTINEGVSVTTIDFALGINLDRATDDVRNAVASIRQNLPADILEPIIQRIDATGQPIVTFIVEGSDMGPDQLSWFVDNDVAKAVLSVRGVAKVERTGGVDPEVRVRLHPDRLMALGITATEVSEQLSAQNVDQPAGRMTLGDAEQTVRALGSAEEVLDLSQRRIALSGQRSAVLADLGTVEQSWGEPRQRALLDLKEVVAFSVFRSIGTGEVAVAEAVRVAVKQFADSHPRVSIVEVTSSTNDVLDGYAAAVEALILGGALAIFVVWLFLRDVRATLVSCLALPLSFLPTFAVLYVFNQSLNSITLLAIALVVGILVDDAIVEVENIVRHMRESGKSAYDSALEAADEIGLAVAATTFAIISVFTPVGFMPGIAGQFFKAFAIAVCSSVFFSLVVARMLTPLLSAHVLRPRDAHDDRTLWVPAYLRLLGWTLRWRWLTVLAGIGLFVASLGLTAALPTDFMPATDRSRSVLALELAPGTTLADTEVAVRRTIEILKARPEVNTVYAAVGAQTSAGPMGDSASSGEVRKATLTISLTPRSKRLLTQQQFEASVSSALAEVPGIRMRFGADGQSGSKVQVTLVSDDAAALSQATADVEREMRTRPNFRNAGSTASLARPEIRVTPNADKAALLGLSSETMAKTISIATQGDLDQRLAKFSLDGRQIPIRVMLQEDARSELPRLLTLQVPTTAGAVPLSSVAEVSFGTGPNQIDRLDRKRSATIEAELAGQTTGEADALIADLGSVKALPSNVTRQAAGDAENMGELFRGFALAMVAGISMLALVIALLFNSLIQPVTILTALPLSIGGAFGLMFFTGTSVSMPALIGLLMLMGIAAKNSILLVEYAITARDELGIDREAALIDAARKRARPIVMTTVAMAAGMMPIAFGLGADAEFRAPMAIAVIGGLISSTLLSLVYVPAVFTVMDDFDLWLRSIARSASQSTASAP